MSPHYWFKKDEILTHSIILNTIAIYISNPRKVKTLREFKKDKLEIGQH